MLTEFLAVALLKGVGAILEFVLQAVVARALGAGLYGQLAFIMGLGESLFYLLFGGMPKITVRYASLGYDFSGIWKDYLVKVALPASLISCFGLALVSESGLIAASSLWAVALLFFMTANAALYGYGRSALAACFEYVLLRVAALCLVLFANRSAPEPNLRAMVFAQLGAYAIVIGLQQVLVFRVARDQAGRRPQGSVVKELLSFQAIELAAHGRGILPRILGYLLGGAVANAYLAIALHVRNAVTVLAGPTTKVFLRQFVQAEPETAARTKVYHSVARLQAYVSVPAFLLVACHTDIIARVFGASFEGADRVIRPIAALAMLEVLVGPASNYFQMTKRHTLELKNQLASLGLLVIGSLFGWLSGSGALAVVIGLAVSTVIMVIVRLCELWVQDRMFPHSRKQMMFLLTLSGAALMAAKVIQEVSNTWGYLGSMAVFASLAPIFFVLSPEIEDRQFVRSTVRGMYGAVSHLVRRRSSER